MKFTQVAADAFEKIQLNAGVLLTDFNPTDGSMNRSDIIGATSGGVSFTASPEFLDFGEDIDNVPNNTMELKRLDSITATMSGTFLTVDTEMCARLIGAADVDPTSGKVTPRADLLQSDFSDVWWVGDYSNVNTGESAGFIAIRLINALSTGGFQIQSGDKAKGQYSFEFTGHYSMSDTSVVPYEVYVRDGGDDATLRSLTVGGLTLVPRFSSSVTSYEAETTNATNAVTATPTDAGATVSISNGGTTVTNGASASWSNGENTLTITVTNGSTVKTYTVVVTKS